MMYLRSSDLRDSVNTEDRSLLLKPNAVWNGRREIILKVTVMSDCDYTKDDYKKSVSGWSTFLNREATPFRTKLIPIIALSVTEADLFPAVMCTQDMQFVIRILNSTGLKMKLPMKLEIDNKEAKDITQNWSVGEILRHVKVKQFYREN